MFFTDHIVILADIIHKNLFAHYHAAVRICHHKGCLFSIIYSTQPVLYYFFYYYFFRSFCLISKFDQKTIFFHNFDDQKTTFLPYL